MAEVKTSLVGIHGRRLARRACRALMAVLVCASNPGYAQTPLDIRWADQLMTVHVKDAPTVEVLKRAAELAGVQVVGGEDIVGTVSLDLDREPLPDAIAAVLRGIPYTLGERKSEPSTGSPSYIVTIRGRDSSEPSGTAAQPSRRPIVVPALQDILVRNQEAAAAAEQDEDDVDREGALDQQDELAALENAGTFAQDAPVDPIIEALQEHDNTLVRKRALQALAQRGTPKAVRAIVKALEDDEDAIVEDAVQILGKRTDEATVKLLSTVLVKEGDPMLRIAVLRVLALIADPACVPALTSASRGKDPLVREVSGQMLQEFARRDRISKGA